MRIVVLVKSVPDTNGDRKLSLETGLTDRTSGDQVLDEINERAVEAALTIAATVPDSTVELLSVAPEEALSVIRKGLAMGADCAVQIVDPTLVGADNTLTAEVLAAALKTKPFDLVITGNQSTDGAGGVVPSMISELLDLPALTDLASVALEGQTVRGTRVTDTAKCTLSAELPALVAVTEAFPEGRFPNFKGIMAAKKKPFEVMSLEELGIDAEDFSVPRAIMTAVSERPPREAGVKVVDEGDAAQQLADFLISNRLA
ncbi:electron transfer flavoprotein subunit beta/FixA family protein [Neomicrococcus aestuarii]|uniref:Electron transfer flavoprotein subunit beta n=1 Tax=Neomicrococcus aestuarii TaxID=556325 RepID=A0A1L2ZMZ2_9MICC|nr:electron transfer flavoprotein subunit beta/FixA family protein [Neomicrococcus aestuarii]APF40398.1 electron transfer flavoprotein subunit beta [Neomicrococcus aestuarii]